LEVDFDNVLLSADLTSIPEPDTMVMLSVLVCFIGGQRTRIKNQFSPMKARDRSQSMKIEG
ncbi:MAG: hypothetical protein AAF939_19495, partial [Planctomycetota bacterium]